MPEKQLQRPVCAEWRGVLLPPELAAVHHGPKATGLLGLKPHTVYVDAGWPSRRRWSMPPRS